MEGEKRSWTFNVLVFILEKIMAFAVADIRAYGALTTKQPLNQIQWTLFRYVSFQRHMVSIGQKLTLRRVPLLNNGDAKPVHASIIGDGTESLHLTRKSMAQWLLQELKEREWVGKAPMISNPGWM
jgi:hypothetical protein